MLLEIGWRTEREGEQEQRRKREQHREDSHPEVCQEAFPEERKFFFFLDWIEVEEERTEGELKQKPQV